jgi:hypothetical protein
MLSSCNDVLDSSITIWDNLFYNCSGLQNINLSGNFIPDYPANTSISATFAFYNCAKILYDDNTVDTINAKLYNRSDLVLNIDNMFTGSSLENEIN